MNTKLEYLKNNVKYLSLLLACGVAGIAAAEEDEVPVITVVVAVFVASLTLAWPLLVVWLWFVTWLCSSKGDCMAVRGVMAGVCIALDVLCMGVVGALPK